MLCTIIWYNILYQINRVSKLLQSPGGSLEVLKSETGAVRKYLEQFRLNGLAASKTDTKEIAEALKLQMTFPEKRQRKTTQQFLYESRAETQSIPEEHFNRDFSSPLWTQPLPA